MLEMEQMRSIIRTEIDDTTDPDTLYAYELLKDLTIEGIQATATEKAPDFSDLDILISGKDTQR